MNESLKTLRFLHQFLMVATAGVFILGMTPDPSRDYNAALDELISLKAIETHQPEYGSYLRKSVPVPGQDLTGFFLSLARETGARISDNFEIPQPFASDYGYSGSRLMDYEGFFAGIHKIAPLQLDLDEGLKDSIRQFLKDQIAIQSPSHPGLSFEGFQLSVGGMGRLPDGTYILDWRNIPPEHRLTGSLQFIFANAQSQRNPRFAVSIAVAYSVGKTEEGSFALDWLQSTAVGKHLVDPKSKTVFLKLKRLSFWKGLSFKDIDNATSYLQQKLDSVKTETVSFFGISVNKTVSVWAAPLTCLSIEWFFLWHFRRFVLHDANETATDYPWIALFPGRLNGITTYSSLALLPVCANSILLFFYGHGGEWATKGGAACILLMTAVGALIFREVHGFRARWLASFR